MKVLKRAASPEETKMARDMGWKEVLRKRLAYIRKVYAERTQSQAKTSPQAAKCVTQLKPARSTAPKIVEQKQIKPVAGKAEDQKPKETILDQKAVRPSTGKTVKKKASKVTLTQSEANLAKKELVKQKQLPALEGKSVNQTHVGLPITKTLEQKSVRPSTGRIIDEKTTKTLHSEANFSKKTSGQGIERTASSSNNKKIIQVK
nr:unnamed protein product [Callosobruchus analis]